MVGATIGRKKDSTGTTIVRTALAIVGAAHMVAWTGYAIAVSSAAVYSFYRDVWGMWLLFGVLPAVLALVAAWRTSRGAAAVYGIASVVGVFGVFGALLAFAAMDEPEWAWVYQIFPLTTAAGVFIGPIAAALLPSRSVTGAS